MNNDKTHSNTRGGGDQKKFFSSSHILVNPRKCFETKKAQQDTYEELISTIKSKIADKDQIRALNSIIKRKESINAQYNRLLKFCTANNLDFEKILLGETDPEAVKIPVKSEIFTANLTSKYHPQYQGYDFILEDGTKGFIKFSLPKPGFKIGTIIKVSKYLNRYVLKGQYDRFGNIVK